METESVYRESDSINNKNRSNSFYIKQEQLAKLILCQLSLFKSHRTVFLITYKGEYYGNLKSSTAEFRHLIPGYYSAIFYPLKHFLMYSLVDNVKNSFKKTYKIIEAFFRICGKSCRIRTTILKL